MPDPFFNILLDTTGPQSPSVQIAGGSAFTPVRIVDLTIGTVDTPTTGYSMKIWGDIDPSFNASIQPAEADSAWLTYNTTQQIELSDTDGNKTIYIKLRDDLWNPSAQASAVISYDSGIPIVTIMSGPTPAKISKIAQKDESEFVFSCNETFIQYIVKVVPATGSTHDAGTQIPTTGGSVNMGGTGTFQPDTNITCSIKGADLETASSGDGNKIVKVFCKDQAGNWSA